MTSFWRLGAAWPKGFSFTGHFARPKSASAMVDEMYRLTGESRSAAVLSEASTSIHDWLVFSERVGPLSGKTAISAVAMARIVAGLSYLLLTPPTAVAWRTSLEGATR